MASIKDLKRMCKKEKCFAGCPLCRGNISCLPDSLPDNADEIVDKWVQEHPVKTYAMDFFEKFPNAQRKTDERTPMACVEEVYDVANVNCLDGELCETCWNCWNREMKEDD